MFEYGIKSRKSDLYELNIKSAMVHWNYEPAQLYEKALLKGEGVIADSGALMVDTSIFTGRAPKDKYVVKDENTENIIWWSHVNQPIEPAVFDAVLDEMTKYLYDKELFARDGYAGADPNYRIKVRFVNTYAWQNLFCYNMFIRPIKKEIETFMPDWVVIDAPEFRVDPRRFGIRSSNFAFVSFSKKLIIIGGSGYAGEIKKGVFTVMNYVLPHEKGILPMHCSANEGRKGDTAIFFGLSGTGKTTLSADPKRALIGDDEHGWTKNGIFNFEGGCYAKVINLTKEKEPQIWDAIKFGAILENTRFFPDTRHVNFKESKVTENTRVSYPIHHIDHAKVPSIGKQPDHIFFLTCDAYGVLPPISRLNPAQTMYHFISGFTAKVAGTEMGITEPQPTFSACFGAAFLPLHPTTYAEILGKNMKKTKAKVWLVNTGWTGGPFGVGERINLNYTRAMITAALEGKLDNVRYIEDPVFGVSVPTEVPRIPSEMLFPKNTWKDKDKFDEEAQKLADMFIENFKKYKEFANDEILSGAPKSK